MLSRYKRKHLTCIEGRLFVSFEKKLDHMLLFFSHSIFMISYLEIFLFVIVMCFFIVCAEVDLLKLSDEPLK